MRILLAPYEVWGQMQLLAETLRRRGYIATAISYQEPTFRGIINDIHMGFNVRQPRLWRLFRRGLFVSWAIQTFDVFHFFFGKSLLPARLDLPLLKRLGKKVLVHFRGSGIQSHSFVLHQKEQFFEEQTVYPPIMTTEERRFLERWRRYADVIMVSTPDLLRIVPEAKLVQQAIDLSRWEYDQSQWTVTLKKYASRMLPQAVIRRVPNSS